MKIFRYIIMFCMICTIGHTDSEYDGKIRKATEYFQCMNLDESIKICREIIASEPSEDIRCIADFGIGSCLLEKSLVFGQEQERSKAAISMEQILSASPETLRNGAAKRLAAGWVDKNNPQSFTFAINKANAYLNKNPDSSDAWLLKGIVLHTVAKNKGTDFIESDKCLMKAIELDPKNFEAIFFHTDILKNDQKSSEALTIAKKNRDLPAPTALFSSGVSPSVFWTDFLPSENEREKELKAIIASEPENGQAYYNLVLSLSVQKKNDDARKYLDTLIQGLAAGNIHDITGFNDTLKCKCLYKLASMQVVDKDYEKAIDTYREIEKISPFYSDIQYNMGTIHMNQALKHLESAKDNLQKAVEQNRNNNADKIKPHLETAKKILEEMKPAEKK